MGNSVPLVQLIQPQKSHASLTSQGKSLCGESQSSFCLRPDIFGISDHDLMFSQENPAREMEEEEEIPAENMPAVTAQHEDYIRHRVYFLYIGLFLPHLSACVCGTTAH